MNKTGEIYARIVDAKYVPDYGSFMLVVEDVATQKVLTRPLQVTKAVMLRIAGINENNPVVTDELLHHYAKLLRQRSPDNPIKLQWSDVDEFTPAVQQALDMSNRADELRTGVTMDEFRQNLKRGIILDE